LPASPASVASQPLQASGPRLGRTGAAGLLCGGASSKAPTRACYCCVLSAAKLLRAPSPSVSVSACAALLRRERREELRNCSRALRLGSDAAFGHFLRRSWQRASWRPWPARRPSERAERSNRSGKSRRPRSSEARKRVELTAKAQKRRPPRAVACCTCVSGACACCQQRLQSRTSAQSRAASARSWGLETLRLAALFLTPRCAEQTSTRERRSHALQTCLNLKQAAQRCVSGPSRRLSGHIYAHLRDIYA
jgi:hypothetical protein